MWRLVEIHHNGIRLAENRPGGKAFTVGIAALGEVHPVSGDGFRDRQVGFACLWIIKIEVLENVGHLHTMR